MKWQATLAVVMLLGAHGEIQGLEGPRLAAVESRQQVQHRGIGGERQHICISETGILHTQPRTQSAIGVLAGKFTREPVHDAIRPAVEIRIRKLEHCITIFVEGTRYLQ